MRSTLALLRSAPAALALFVALALTACAGSSAYQKAEQLSGTVAPLLATTFEALLPAQDLPAVRAAMNAVGALLSAWQRADKAQFDALIPCTVVAIDQASEAVRFEGAANLAVRLRGVGEALGSLLPVGGDKATCVLPGSPSDDADAGSADATAPTVVGQ